jgi:hypothetical protein
MEISQPRSGWKLQLCNRVLKQENQRFPLSFQDIVSQPFRTSHLVAG